MEDGAFLHGRNGFERLAAATDLPRTPVLSLALSPENSVWLGTRDAGLFRRTEDRPRRSEGTARSEDQLSATAVSDGFVGGNRQRHRALERHGTERLGAGFAQPFSSSGDCRRIATRISGWARIRAACCVSMATESHPWTKPEAVRARR